MPSIPVTTIDNVSNQIVSVIYQEGDPLNNAGDVHYQSSGTLSLKPGSSTTIETNRLDIGQLANLEEKNLIKTTASLQ